MCQSNNRESNEKSSGVIREVTEQGWVAVFNYYIANLITLVKGTCPFACTGPPLLLPRHSRRVLHAVQLLWTLWLGGRVRYSNNTVANTTEQKKFADVPALLYNSHGAPVLMINERSRSMKVVNQMT